jgi:hypothetical protein
MSMVPMNSSLRLGQDIYGAHQFVGCEGWSARYGEQKISQFRGAELVCDRWQLTRAELEAFALVSNQRAIAASKRNALPPRSRRSAILPATKPHAWARRLQKWPRSRPFATPLATQAR